MTIVNLDAQVCGLLPFRIAHSKLTTVMSQPRKSTRKKRQTQLSFSPFPSSSPAASRNPEQIQRRAASVRYDSDMASPTKRRRVWNDYGDRNASSPVRKSTLGQVNVQVGIDSPDKKCEQLLTPAASSQVERRQEDSNWGMH